MAADPLDLPALVARLRDLSGNCDCDVHALMRDAAAALATLTADRDQQARRADEAERELAECYRLTGADPDGDEDWRLAQHAVAEVRRLREEADSDGRALDKAEVELDTLRAQVREFIEAEDEAERRMTRTTRLINAERALRAQLAAIVEKINAAIEECRKDGLCEPAHEQGLDEALDIIRAIRTQEPPTP